MRKIRSTINAAILMAMTFGGIGPSMFNGLIRRRSTPKAGKTSYDQERAWLAEEKRRWKNAKRRGDQPK